jgi:dCTP deaminase
MILPDFQLEQVAAAGLVKPFDRHLINPASIDLRLAPTILIESLQGSGLVPLELTDNTPENPYLLKPGQFILAATAERITMPAELAGQVQLKSTVARQGLEHLMAGWIDPGFTGTITLELHNSRQLQPVAIWPGMRVAQLVLLTMAAPPTRSYAITGRYNGQQLPTGPRLPAPITTNPTA